MPGFMVFKELGVSDSLPGVAKALAKAALANIPGSWKLHGLGGEYNVDVDPIAAAQKLMDGDFPDSFWEAYKGWIPVVGIQQSFTSEAEAERRDIEGDLIRQNKIMAEKAANAAVQAAMPEIEAIADQKAYERTLAANPDANIAPPGQADTSGGGVFKTGMSAETSGVERISVEVDLDASFPKLLKAALKPDSKMGGPKIFSSADIHLCTTAAIDTRQLVMNSDSAAAQMIEALVGLLFFNVIPYLTVSMEDVQVTEVSYNLQGDSDGSTPSATVVLEYKEITWTYHVINGSNMNLFSLDFSYDVRKRKDPSGGLKLGSMLNPFA